MADRPELSIATGPLAGRRYTIPRGGLRLGRSSSNDISIPDESLSRNHCLFEQDGADGIRIIDLASANGTYLNDEPLGSDPVTLKPGDEIETGGSIIRVVAAGEADAAANSDGVVDLGLDDPLAFPDDDDDGADGAAARAKPKRSKLSTALWAVAALLVLGAAATVLLAPLPEPEPEPAAPKETAPELLEFSYEKVDATTNGIFRSELRYTGRDKRLRVAVNDASDENRHLAKERVLDARALAELAAILDWKKVKEMDSGRTGEDPIVPSYSSLSLRVVYAGFARTCRIVNDREPDGFRAMRDRLERFAKNELGVWALQYSRERLVAMAEESIRTAQAKWEDRDVQHGNLFGAVSAYRDAISYLETVNPKPDCAIVAQTGLETARAELDRKFSEQRFRADRAINMGQWEEARTELATLLEIVPDRKDERNLETTAKLVDVERRLKKSAKGGRR